MEAPTDLANKYQKLASEYAKLRAQVSVLKKAVLDEQAKNVVLKDDLQSKDTSLRKVEQEMDSLTFRNTQLEKRVGFLQDELAVASVKGKSKQSKLKAGPPPQQEQQPVFDYELLSKIEENIQLHKQISELEENSRREVINVRCEYEDKLRDCNGIKDLLKTQAQEVQSLSISLQNSKDEIEAYRDQVVQLQDKIRSVPVNNVVSVPSEVPESGATTASHVNRLPEEPEQSGVVQENLCDRLVSAEQQREHWMLEYSLLKMKYSKLFKKWEELQTILKGLGRDDLMKDIMTPCTEANPLTTMVGRMEIITDDDSWPHRSFEREIKEHLTGRINELIAQLQLADSQASTFYDECTALQTHLIISASEKSLVESQLEQMRKALADLQEELQVVKNNYESQLVTMTEHLTSMNDKLSQQADTIQELQYQLGAKGTKKK